MYSLANNITEDRSIYRCEPWVKIRFLTYGFFIFSFCEELGQNRTIYTFYFSLWDPIKTRVQNDISGCYVEAFLNLWHINGRRSGQVYDTVLPRKYYYSCQKSRVCVAFV